MVAGIRDTLGHKLPSAIPTRIKVGTRDHLGAFPTVRQNGHSSCLCQCQAAAFIEFKVRLGEAAWRWFACAAAGELRHKSTKTYRRGIGMNCPSASSRSQIFWLAAAPFD